MDVKFLRELKNTSLKNYKPIEHTFCDKPALTFFLVIIFYTLYLSIFCVLGSCSVMNSSVDQWIMSNIIAVAAV